MGRPKSVENNEILETARRVFLNKGVRGTTLEIAESLGVSETLIFKRFKTKRALFEAAMKAPPFDLAARLKPRLGKGVLREQLAEVLVEVIEYLRILTPLTMMVWAHPQIDPKVHFQSQGEDTTLVLLKALASYFEEERRRQRLGRFEPEVLARVILGSLSNFVFYELMGVQLRLPMSSKAYVQHLLKIVLDGVSADSGS